MNYKKIYDQIITNRKNNPYNGYTETHHILPRSLGGTDDKNNLVNLSAREHYICHLLLTKIYNKKDEYHKMVHAFIMMCNVKSTNQERDYSFNSNVYKSLREDYSLLMSENQKGELNSQFGTNWIYNPVIKESKKVPKGLIVEGWYSGRVVDWTNHFTQMKCIHCETIGLLSKKSKFCSIECKKDHIKKKSFLYSNIDKFKEIYLLTKSINESLIELGKIGAGGYYDQAVEIIKQDEKLYEIYLTTVK